MWDNKNKNLEVPILIKLISVCVRYLLDNWIAVISLLIALVTLNRSKKKIDVSWDQNLTVVPLDSVYTRRHDGNPMSYHKAMTASVNVINPTSTALGFFDLRAFDPETNLNFDIVTKRVLPREIGPTDLFVIVQTPSKLITDLQLDIPDRTFGTFPPNSNTNIDVVVLLDQKNPNIKTLEKINFSFKVAKKSLFKRDYYSKSSSHHKYEFHGISYSLNNFDEDKWPELSLEQPEEEKVLENNTQGQQPTSLK
ncbi:hypothetical protein [Furfurilactobacillus siliginis]|uniref:hypothetical protein n=1 Tax=Furfurilactobacillus siliginis TaxID=348151 RepID=UPI00070F2147|nr:hypothetical protein [Furfurilactobacillus siliginis]